MTARELKPLCPDCGSALQIVQDAVVNEADRPGYIVRGAKLPRRERPAAVVVCTGCEFCIEIR
jgi:hypothetical protein